MPNKANIGPPTELEFEKALMFFHAYMYGPLQGKLRLYAARQVRSAGTAMSSDWEVFASILLKDVGQKLSAGIDLTNYEVKSAVEGGSYEYQYRKNTAKQKLAGDLKVAHLSFAHANNLRKVNLRYAQGSQMKAYFGEWLQNIRIRTHSAIEKTFLSAGSKRTGCCWPER